MFTIISANHVRHAQTLITAREITLNATSRRIMCSNISDAVSTLMRKLAFIVYSCIILLTFLKNIYEYHFNLR